VKVQTGSRSGAFDNSNTAHRVNGHATSLGNENYNEQPVSSLSTNSRLQQSVPKGQIPVPLWKQEQDFLQTNPSTKHSGRNIADLKQNSKLMANNCLSPERGEDNGARARIDDVDVEQQGQFPANPDAGDPLQSIYPSYHHSAPTSPIPVFSPVTPSLIALFQYS
jgi:hypothetical protein